MQPQHVSMHKMNVMRLSQWLSKKRKAAFTERNMNRLPFFWRMEMLLSTIEVKTKKRKEGVFSLVHTSRYTEMRSYFKSDYVPKLSSGLRKL